MDGIAITRASENFTATNLVGRFAEGDKGSSPESQGSEEWNNLSESVVPDALYSLNSITSASPCVKTTSSEGERAGDIGELGEHRNCVYCFDQKKENQQENGTVLAIVVTANRLGFLKYWPEIISSALR